MCHMENKHLLLHAASSIKHWLTTFHIPCFHAFSRKCFTKHFLTASISSPQLRPCGSWTQPGACCLAVSNLQAQPTTIETPNSTPAPCCSGLADLGGQVPTKLMGHGVLGVCIGFVEVWVICVYMSGTAWLKQCAGLCCTEVVHVCK